MKTKINNFVSRWKSHRKMKNAMNELHALSDRELNDIGISRSGIRAAVYGK